MAVVEEIQGMEPRFAEKVDLSDVIFTRLRPGEEIFERIQAICKENDIQRAVVLSGMGSLEDVTFVNPVPHAVVPFEGDGKFNVQTERGPFELLTLEGTVFPISGEFGALKEGDLMLHLHGTLSWQHGTLMGGHLRSAKVFTTVELFIARIKGSVAKKRKSAVTALAELRTDMS